MDIRTGTSTETWHMDEHAAEVFLAAEHLGHRIQVPAHTTIYRQTEQGSTFFFVVRGRVQVEILQEDGSEFILELMGPRSLFGEGSALANMPRMSTASTLEPCTLIKFDYSVIKKSFPEHIEFATALMEVAAMKQCVLGLRIQFLAMPKSDLRIVELLNRLANLYGAKDAEGTRIHIPLTHELIAALTGTSRVTVTRTITKLKSEGVVMTKGRYFWVKSKNS